MKTTCFDCYVYQQLGHPACHRHMTIEERADFERYISALAQRDHPMLKFLKRPA